MDVKSPAVVRAAGLAIATAALAGFVYGVLQNPKKSSDVVSPGVAMNGVDLSKLSAAAPVDNAVLADAALKPRAARPKANDAAADDAPDDKSAPDVQPVDQPSPPPPSTPTASNSSQPPY